MPQIEISNAAFDFLKSRAKPLEDTTVTVVDAFISEFKALSGDFHPNNSKGVVFGVRDAPSMKFTTVIDAEVNGRPASQNYWNNILEDVITACVEKSGNSTRVMELMSANIRNGRHSENGYRFVSRADFSFQGLEANRAFKNIVKLAIEFQISLSINVKWPNRDDAAMPNAIAEVR